MSYSRVYSILLFILALRLSSVLGLPRPIIGGYSARLMDLGEFPYFVALEYNHNQICGGSLIQPDLILTAAHCVRGLDVLKFKVRAGTYVSKGKDGQVRTVKAIKVNGEYQLNCRECDVALIKLNSAFNLTKTVQVIQMAEKNLNTNIIGEKLIMLGLGEIKNEKVPSSLIVARIKVLSRNYCKKLLKKSLPKTYICTLGVNRDTGACDGDSGGPVVKRVPNSLTESVLVGVIAYIQLDKEKNCDSTLPTAHSNVALLRPWINNYLKEDAWIENETDL